MRTLALIFGFYIACLALGVVVIVVLDRWCERRERLALEVLERAAEKDWPLWAREMEDHQ